MLAGERRTGPRAGSQITRATKELLADEFVCEPRGTIPVKGKGEIEAWSLVDRSSVDASPSEVTAVSA
jgi:hypothetical protein